MGIARRNLALCSQPSVTSHESRKVTLQEYYDPEEDVEIPRPFYLPFHEHVRFRLGVDILHFNWDVGDLDNAHALQSGLFGKLELDPVRYVDPWDSETLRRYHQLWQAQNHILPRPWTRQIAASAEFFALLDCDKQPLHDRVTRWKEYIDRCWAWNEYWKAKDAEPESVPHLDMLFLPPYPSYDWEEDDETYYYYFKSKYTLNRAHPWIQAVLKKMPFFQPMILFRHRTGVGCLQNDY
ncbi:hypothetical protein N7520_001418 [Penicillium odoratum]|uniref:uncharacterized protein n=1 Tax=Penicillium odoratum TaxID=1167516 RepID=UPI0025489251|nr:uncharacterized protein N7520_001418 [Penicillium odoratum]KAJ5778172.1 hypothetical protein N7520_001418 [Penicillium odoratum]